jgi:hypothetical protein
MSREVITATLFKLFDLCHAILTKYHYRSHVVQSH